MIKPKTIQQFPSGELGIIWEDDHECVYAPQLLRKKCPCASCSGHHPGEKKAHPFELKVIKENPGQFTITQVIQVGHYAIGLHWADGHDTGIYTYDLLRELCQ